MSKKIISSKETYFKRPNNPMTLEDWNDFKLANPRPEYLGETCWSLHDSMILRGKPADDSAIVKTLLKEVGVEFEQHADYLKITSDLTGKDILVIEIECDELLEQLAAAGAKVLYITSNVNYGVKVPEKYFEMYNDSAYDTNDYPATDKRNMFTNKNVIIKYINFNDYKNKGLYYIFLQNALKEHNMKINKVLMNPPYDGSLHLEVLEATLKAAKETNTECEVVSVQPCDWLENPLTTYKGGEYKKFFNKTLLALTNLQVIDMMTAQKAFNIGTDVDLGIYTYSLNKPKFDLDLIRASIANRCFNKIITKLDTMKTLNDVLDEKAVDGWRVKLNELRPQSGGTNPKANGYSHKTWGIQLVSSTEDGIKECVFKDGYNDKGIYWTNVRSKNQFGKSDGAAFRHSIKTEDKQTALNIAESCNTNFYRNWIYLIKFNQHMPLRFLPYMGEAINPLTSLKGYESAWTDEAYCKFFGLTEEESEFMCRKVDDYRVKDFINYINLDEE